MNSVEKIGAGEEGIFFSGDVGKLINSYRLIALAEYYDFMPERYLEATMLTQGEKALQHINEHGVSPGYMVEWQGNDVVVRKKKDYIEAEVKNIVFSLIKV